MAAAWPAVAGPASTTVMPLSVMMAASRAAGDFGSSGT